MLAQWKNRYVITTLRLWCGSWPHLCPTLFLIINRYNPRCAWFAFFGPVSLRVVKTFKKVFNLLDVFWTSGETRAILDKILNKRFYYFISNFPWGAILDALWKASSNVDEIATCGFYTDWNVVSVMWTLSLTPS